MKQNLIVIIIIFSFVGCKTVSDGNYNSSCMLYGKTELKLKINKDGTFAYNFLYNEETVYGKWTIKSDTLILNSSQFLAKRDSLSPKIKNTDIENTDKYLIKRNKLFVINKSGLSKNCYLTKIK